MKKSAFHMQASLFVEATFLFATVKLGGKPNVIYCYSRVEFTLVDHDSYCATELLHVALINH